MVRQAILIVCVVFMASAAGCVVEGTVGSLQPLVVADARGDAVGARPDASVDAARDASLDAGDDVRDAAVDVAQDVRQTEVSTPEVPLCGPEGTCPLARYCSRTLCQAPWSGCGQDEKCNGLDDDCDGVRDNGIDCGSGDPCPAGLARCGGVCVDLASDNAHCGRCDRPCASACANGYCP
ncbi:MAG: hypothetical protein U0269_36440 [Polyangiales bacterium]